MIWSHENAVPRKSSSYDALIVLRRWPFLVFLLAALSVDVKPALSDDISRNLPGKHRLRGAVKNRHARSRNRAQQIR